MSVYCLSIHKPPAGKLHPENAEYGWELDIIWLMLYPALPLQRVKMTKACSLSSRRDLKTEEIASNSNTWQMTGQLLTVTL